MRSIQTAERQLQRASIVPPPFGSGYYRERMAGAGYPLSFNRAAPFRERL